MIQHKPKCKTCHKIILKQCESIEVDIKYIILIFNSKIQIGGRKVKKGEREREKDCVCKGEIGLFTIFFNPNQPS
jgi:hypothetical protein